MGIANGLCQVEVIHLVIDCMHTLSLVMLVILLVAVAVTFSIFDKRTR